MSKDLIPSAMGHGSAGEKLEERLAIRPTSETMFGHMYSKWIQSIVISCAD